MNLKVIIEKKKDINNNVLIKKKNMTCHLVDFTVPAEYRLGMKEDEKIDKYLDLARCNIIGEGFRFIYLSFRFS